MSETTEKNATYWSGYIAERRARAKAQFKRTSEMAIIKPPLKSLTQEYLDRKRGQLREPSPFIEATEKEAESTVRSVLGFIEMINGREPTVLAEDEHTEMKELIKLRAWKAEAVAFLRAEVNCDCETGYLCSRCALLVE